MKEKIFYLACLALVLFMSVPVMALTTEEAVMIERLKYDPDGDGKVGLEVAVNALQIVAGIKPAVYTNLLDMSFKQLPAGSFMMGSPADELGRWDAEDPQHPVTVSSFYMQTTEVTQAQWEAVMGTNPSYFTACGGTCPVEQVSWDMIQEFITKMNQRGEGTYRLPTEAEWEYAARAGSTTAFYNGDITNTDYTPVDPNLDAIGWYYGNSAVTYTPNSSGKGTHPVGQKLPNDWGLYDMSGNVWEWVEDDWHDNYTGAPADGIAWVDSPRGVSRVLRGGSWLDRAQYCRSALRSNSYPSSRDGSFGFRLVVSPGQ